MEDKLIDKIIKDEINNEDIKIPDSIDLKLKKAYDIIEKEEVIFNKKKIKSKKIIKKRVAVAAGLVFGFLGVATLNPVFAENIPGVGAIVKYLNNSLSYNSNIEKYSDDINIVQNKNDMEIRLEGVTYDESSLKFIYTVTSKEKLQWGVQMRNTSLKINGKDVLNRNKDNWITNKEFDIADNKIEDLEDGGEKYAVINSYDISDIKLDEDVEIDWTINEIHLHDGIYNKGPWNFKFKTSKEKLSKDTKILNVNKKFDVEGYEYILNKIIITPVEVKLISNNFEKLYKDLTDVRLQIEKNSKAKDVDILVNNESERMEKLILGLDDTEKNKQLIQKYYKLSEIENKLMQYLDAKITDENGESLQGIGGEADKNKRVVTYRPFKTMPKKIIMIPEKNVNQEKWYERMFEEGYFKCSLEDLKPGAEFKQAENKSIVINSVEKSDDTLKLNISYKGIGKIDRFSMSTICLVETDKSIKDKRVCDDSEYIKRGKSDKEMAAAQENLDSVNITYNLDKNKKYNVWIQKSYNEDEYYDVNNRIEFEVK